MSYPVAIVEQRRIHAANELVGRVPDLLPVIREEEQKRSNQSWQRRRPGKTKIPPLLPGGRQKPDADHQVDDYA
jgi:hypothetical protein